MSRATQEQMGELHSLVAESLLAYMRGRPQDKHRASWLALVRAFLRDNGYPASVLTDDVKKQMQDLHGLYIQALVARVKEENVPPALLAEVGTCLRAHGILKDAEAGLDQLESLCLLGDLSLPFKT